MPRLMIGGLLTLALVVAACGSSAQTGPAGEAGASGASMLAGGGSGPDACSLLSKAEVEAAVGNPVEDGVPDILNSCKWEVSDPTQISVGLHLLALGAAYCAVGHAGSSPVDGLSVAASWEFITPAATGSVLACTGGWQVQVTLVGDIVGHTTAEATLRAAGVQLMGLVLGRM